VSQHAIAESAHSESVLLQKHARTVLATTTATTSTTGASSSGHMITLREGQPLQELLSAVQAAVTAANSSNTSTNTSSSGGGSGVVVSGIEWLPTERAVRLRLQ
jgi:hypothetical protein